MKIIKCCNSINRLSFNYESYNTIIIQEPKVDRSTSEYIDIKLKISNFRYLFIHCKKFVGDTTSNE